MDQRREKEPVLSPCRGLLGNWARPSLSLGVAESIHRSLLLYNGGAAVAEKRATPAKARPEVDPTIQWGVSPALGKCTST